MATQKVVLADLNEIIFETRDKEYGAYDLRKRYNRSLVKAILIASLVFCFGICSPKLYNKMNAAPLKPKMDFDPREVVAEITNFKEKEEEVVLPVAEQEKKPAPPTIEVRVPVPTNEPLDDKTIHDMDSIEKVGTPGLVDAAGDSTAGGYDFDIEEKRGPRVIKVQLDNIPGPVEYVVVSREPAPVNMNDIKKQIGYPREAVEVELEGKVIVRILVGKDGSYQKHIIVRNPHPILTKAVEEQLPKLSFLPGLQGSNPVYVWVTIPFEFHLNR